MLNSKLKKELELLKKDVDKIKIEILEEKIENKINELEKNFKTKIREGINRIGWYYKSKGFNEIEILSTIYSELNSNEMVNSIKAKLYDNRKNKKQK